MTQTSWPFDGQVTTEDQYGRLFREFSQSGVSASQGTSALEVTASGSTMNVQVAAGMAVVRGCMYRSTATENVLLAAPPSGTRIYMVALELNQTTNEITLVAIAGAGAAEPVVLDNSDANDTGTFHVPLARVTVASGATAVSAGSVADRRRFVGRSAGAWSGPSTRPTGPRKGEVGYSAAINSFEFWDGSAWQRVGSLAGEMKIFAGATLPGGWLLCDGGSHSTATYPELFAAIGYSFGGSGSSFNVPNLVNRVPRGGSTMGAAGNTGGADSATLTTGHMPQHTHGINHDHGAVTTAAGGTHTHTVPDGAGTASVSWSLTEEPRDAGSTQSTGSAGSHTHTVDLPSYAGTSGGAGSASPTPVPTVPSHVVLNFIIRT